MEILSSQSKQDKGFAVNVLEGSLILLDDSAISVLSSAAASSVGELLENTATVSGCILIVQILGCWHQKTWV